MCPLVSLKHDSCRDREISYVIRTTVIMDGKTFLPFLALYSFIFWIVTRKRVSCSICGNTMAIAGQDGTLHPVSVSIHAQDEIRSYGPCELVLNSVVSDKMLFCEHVMNSVISDKMPQSFVSIQMIYLMPLNMIIFGFSRSHSQPPVSSHQIGRVIHD